MAKATLPVISALKQTAKNLVSETGYQWGHMGSCNCGNLAQVITHKDKANIHREAMRGHGDWTDQLFDYCPKSGLPFDHIIDEMLLFGFTREDLAHLERLSDPEILSKIPAEKRHLTYNKRDDVVCYLNTWANILEEKLLFGIEIVLPYHESVNLPV